MKKKYIITEKIIGGLLILVGTIFLLATISDCIQLCQIAIGNALIPQKGFINLSIKIYHYQILVALLSIFAGLTLILNKKIGWSIAIVTIFLSRADFVLIQFAKVQINILSVYFIIGLLYNLLFLTFGLLLLSKPFVTKYRPSKINWIVICTCFIILLADNLWVRYVI